jgi:ankyrin repeat/SOCS box protein 13/metal transporter CNNM
LFPPFSGASELKEFVNIHSGSRLQNDALVEEEHDGLPAEERLSYDEVLIIKGALDLKTKSVKDIMTPLSSVFVLDVDSCLDQATLKKVPLVLVHACIQSVLIWFW